MTTKQKEIPQKQQKKQTSTAQDARIWNLTLWGKTPTAIKSLKSIAEEILMSPGVRASRLYDEACVCISSTRRTIVTFEASKVTFGNENEGKNENEKQNSNQECKHKKSLLFQDHEETETGQMLKQIAYQKVPGTGQSVLVTSETLFVEDQMGPLQVLVVVLRDRPPEQIKFNPRHIVSAQGWTWSPVPRDQEHRLFKTIGESLGRGDVVSIQGPELTILILETNPFFGKEDTPETKQTITALKSNWSVDKHYEARLKCVLETARTRSYRDRFFMPVITQGLVWFLSWLHTSLTITETSMDGPKVEFRSRRPLCYIWVGESQIGKSFLIQTIVKPLGFKYHRGNIDWMNWDSSIGHVIDDLSNADTTTLAALKTIINSTDEGDVRRIYGYSHISPAVTVLLLNAEAFVVLRQECSKQGMLKWMEENSIVFPPETHWAVCVEEKNTFSAQNPSPMQSMNALAQSSLINPTQSSLINPTQSSLMASMIPPTVPSLLPARPSQAKEQGLKQGLEAKEQGFDSDRVFFSKCDPPHDPTSTHTHTQVQEEKPASCSQLGSKSNHHSMDCEDCTAITCEDPSKHYLTQQGLTQQGLNQQRLTQQELTQQGLNQQRLTRQGLNHQELNHQGLEQNTTRGFEPRMLVVDKEPDEWYSDTQLLYDPHRETTQAMFEASLKDLSMCVETHVLEKLKQEGMPAIIPKALYLRIARHVVEHVENVMERTIVEDPDLSCETESERESCSSVSERERGKKRRVLSYSVSQSPSLVESFDSMQSQSQTDEWDLMSREDQDPDQEVWEEDVPKSKRAIHGE